MKHATAKHKPWQDHYSRRAKKERYPARSVYKLAEIQKKYRMIKKGHKVLDLGCSPGSWLLYAAELTGNKGQVIGIDLKPVSIQVPRRPLRDCPEYCPKCVAAGGLFCQQDLSGFGF
jgi:23S rRNA (uridine2552-2'-O)-methyltransferase